MPSQIPTDNSCLIRLANICQEPVGLWLEAEARAETPMHDVLKATAAFSAYMAADILKQNIKHEVPYDLIATISLWFLDSLRVGLNLERPSQIGVGKGNGNGDLSKT